MANYSYGRLMLDLAGTQLSDNERQLLRDPQVGGVILFARNLSSRDQLTALVAEMRALSEHLLIAVDQEGGRVQRFRDDFTRLPAMQQLGDAVEQGGEAGLALSRDVGWLMASEMLACGLDISFAPVVDVDRATSSIIGDRSFSDQPDLVVETARAFVQGMHEAGMAATGKHFPGHGGIVADSHHQVAVDNRHLAELRSRDLQPFTQLATLLDGVMPAHITFPAVDTNSVGFSPYWLQQILRTQIGFEGVIFSDDLTMKGADVAGGPEDKARQALNAGCDMILVCNCRQAALEVLDFIHKTGVKGCGKIATMRARRSISWDQLSVQPRYTDIREKLQAMTGIGY